MLMSLQVSGNGALLSTAHRKTELIMLLVHDAKVRTRFDRGDR
jgi:hypothetical protein